MRDKTEARAGKNAGYQEHTESALYRFILLDAALQYAQQGWPVLPCVERDSKGTPKAPYIRGGFTNASTDPTQIRHWWRQWPGALIGLCPPPSVVVLDLDAATAVSDLVELNGGPLPATLSAVTGRGRHLYYRMNQSLGEVTQGRLRAPDGCVLHGVDVKPGGRGYLIASPSRHPGSGKQYQWTHPANTRQKVPDMTASIVSLPPRLEDALPRETDRTPAPVRDCRAYGHDMALDGLLRTVSQAPEGTRNRSLYWAACRMREHELAGRPSDWRALEAAALGAGLSTSEVRATIQSARNTYRLGGVA